MSWLGGVGLTIAVQVLSTEVRGLYPGFPAWNEFGLNVSPPHHDMLSVVLECKDLQVGPQARGGKDKDLL